MRKSVLILLLLSAVFATGCATHLDYPREKSFALANPEKTIIGQHIYPQELAHPGQSGCRLLPSGLDAFIAKAVFINASQKTVDAQFFLFYDDLIGNFILARLFDAADRGVRVRILIDDFCTTGEDKWLAGISAHKNIEVRVFNPVGSGFRSWWLPRLTQFVAGKQTSRRMHNKALIIDNTIVFVGGRNIADEYFSARDEFNYRDFDMMAVGPVARAASAGFDEFWNDSFSVPIEAFVSKKRAADYSQRVRDKIANTQASARESAYVEKLAQTTMPIYADPNRMPLLWSKCSYLYDPPSDIRTPLNQKTIHKTAAAVLDMLSSSNHQALLITPYLSPDDQVMNKFKQMCAKGLTVKIVTNSLDSMDHVIAYGGYAKYRKRLLQYGVELYEIKRNSMFSRYFEEGEKAMMHTKCYISDSNRTFIGSLNIDHLSEFYNTEDGILVDGNNLTAKAITLYNDCLRSSYKLILDSKTGKLVWLDSVEGRLVRYDHEPRASFFRRFAAWFLGTVTPEYYL